MGCLRALFVRIGCLLFFLALLVLAFLYRREIADYYRAWRGGHETYVAPAEGGAAKAQAVFERLQRGGGPAYEDLSAADVAAFITQALARGAQRRALDSLRIVLLENEIRVRGVLDLTTVPRRLLGPLSGMVGDHEPASIGGPLSVDSTGRLWLTVTYLKLRDFPFPKPTIPRLLDAAHVPGAEGARVPLPGPTRLGDVRVSPGQVRFYRSTPQ